MTPSVQSARVAVPASTSNLGPGFDCLGLALSLHLEVRVLGAAPGAEHAFSRREGHAADWPSAENRFLAGFDAAREAGGGGPACTFAARSEIPVGRGFGSTGSAIAAGLLLGAALSEAPPDLARLHALGVALEGHPDNVTASLFGGLTLCHPSADAGRPLVCREAVSPRLRFVLAWSEQSSSTREARRVLPEKVPFADAVENPRRLALLLAGLRTARRDWIAAGVEDRLHVPYRLGAITGGARALEAAAEAGAWGATISGAGSGLIAIAPEEEAPRVAEAMRSALAEEVRGAEALVTHAVGEAPRVRMGAAGNGAQDGA